MALFPGNPLGTMLPPITGVGPADARAALTQFENTIGGANNSTNPLPQTSGFRTIDWDGVKLDGTDFGGPPNTTVINAGKTVAIPLNRFQSRGVFFEQVYAVSGDGFNDVNPNVAGLFPAFSKDNTFAMFNDNTIDLSFTIPSAATSTPVPAATRGFGAIFLNVQAAGSKIEYFSGDKLVGIVPVPPSLNPGDPEFAGALFTNPIVTRVSLTLGNGVLFTFDGLTATGTTMNNPPATNLVVTDDFAYAEPVPLGSAPPVLSGAQGTNTAQPAVNATLGQPFNGTVATFSDTDATAVAANFTAVINWGDGHITNGKVVANGLGGFDVRATDTPNTYNRAGRFPISVDVQKFAPPAMTAPMTMIAPTQISLTNTAQVGQADTTTTLTANPVTAIVGQPVTLTATVAASQGINPTGLVTFKEGDNILDIVKVDNNGKATLTTTKLTPGAHDITAVFNGDGDFNTSTSGKTTVVVRDDVTSQIRFTLGRIRRRGGRFTQHVDLLNAGDTLHGPLALVLGGLPQRARLLNASGVAMNQIPGSPFIRLVLGPTDQFAQNQTIGVDLLFRSRNARSIRYVPRVFAGPGPV